MGPRTLPTARLAALAFALVAPAIVAGYVPEARLPLALLDALVLAAAGADALLARGLAGRVVVERRAAEVFSMGRENPVTLVLRSTSSTALDLSVDDDPLDDARGGGLPRRVRLGPFERATLAYALSPSRRGRHGFGAVTLRARGPLGLVAREVRIPLPQSVDVYPDVQAARELELLRRRGRQAAVLGSLRVHGGDTEFDRLRPFQRGDERRHVDWRATARRDELVARSYRSESDQTVLFALDLGRAMSGAWDGLACVDRALNATMLAADVALREGDKVGLLAFDDRVRGFTRPEGGAAAARKIVRASFALEPSLAATDFRAAAIHLTKELRARALVVLFTQVLDPRSAKDLAVLVRTLAPKHLPLCVVFRDTDTEDLARRVPGRDEAPLVPAAAAETLAARAELLRDLERRGALVLDVRAEELTTALVRRYLDVKARRLL